MSFKQKELTPKQRLAKFNSLVGKHQWSFIDGDADTKDIKLPGIHCIACNKLIQAVTAMYSRIITDKLNLTEEGTREVNNSLKPYRRVYGVPVYKTGYACKSCYDYLWSDKWYDDKLILHRSIELLEHPINKTTETVTKNNRTAIKTVPLSRPVVMTRDDNYDRGKGERKSVTTLILDHGNEIEEWKSTLLPVEQEPVDVKAYRYFNRGR